MSGPFIRRPIGTCLLALGVFLVGLVAYVFLPVASLPNTDFPTIFVNATQPGADPATMASTVTGTLERHLGQIAGVTNMNSNSALGRANIYLEFDPSRPQADAARDVQAALNAAAADLPSGLPSPPRYRKANPDDRPIMILALTSKTLTTQAIYDAADTVLAQRLAQVEGVAQANAQGSEKPAIRIQADTKRLAAMGLGMEDVRNAITAANVNQATGRMEGSLTAADLATDGALDTVEGYRGLVLRTAAGAVFRLGDIATVFQGTENDRQAAWYGDRPAVLVSIIKQPGANIIDTVDRIRALMPTLANWMPPGIDIAVLNDQTQTIRASVDDVQIALVVSMVLVVLVVAIFLRRLAPTIAAAVAVPVSLAGTFAVMWMLGYSLDNLSLMALTIAVGFVVDDAVVMIENIVRHREMGKPGLQAALEGAREVGFTIVSMTLSLIAVFIPLIFIGGMAGMLFQEFGATLAIAILISGVVSLTLTPAVCARFLDDGKSETRLDRIAGRPLARLTDAYMRSLHWTLPRRRLMLGIMAGTVVATVALFVLVPKGGFPRQDTGLIMAMARAPTDTSFKAMSERMQEAVAVIQADPAVAGIGGSTGGGMGGGGSANRGQMFITLKPKAERKISADQVINRLRPKLARLQGIQVSMFAAQDLNFGGGGGGRNQGAYQVSLLADNLDDLNEWTPALVRRLQQIDGLLDITSDQERAGLNAKVVIDRDAAARLGLQPLEIDNALNDAFAQRQVSTLYGERNQYRVVLEALPQQQRGPQDLTRIYVKTPGGAQVPLSAVAKVEIVRAPLTVTHEGQFPAASISFNLAEGVPTANMLDVVRQAAADIGMPGSMRIELGGAARFIKQQSSGQPMLILAALVIIYIVLGVLYESWAQPLTILSTLPSAGIGAILAMLATGNEMSLISFIGIILLMGIVKKNGIMLVDFALALEREQGMVPEKAMAEACRERFRPILMTTMTAMLGALPLVIGGGAGAELRQPLGIAVFGGLALSQLLTLYTTPAVYLALRRRSAPERLPALQMAGE